MKKIIFLDFDGVMVTYNHCDCLGSKGLPAYDDYGVVFDPNCVRNLRRIIDSTSAGIVVSSSWRKYMTSEEMLEMWRQRDLPGTVIGELPIISRNRGEEIDRWLEECHAECDYVIIDDADADRFCEHQRDRLFIVNPYNGLDEDTASRIISHFDKRPTT